MQDNKKHIYNQSPFSSKSRNYYIDSVLEKEDSAVIYNISYAWYGPCGTAVGVMISMLCSLFPGRYVANFVVISKKAQTLVNLQVFC